MNLFQAVKEAVSTKEAAERYGIKANRSGMACCPFHDDRTPSLKLDRRYHCFGCGADGDVIDFTAELFGLGKKDAALKLAHDFGVICDAWKPPDQKNWRSGKRKTRLLSPEARFAETEKRFYRILTDYYHLLRKWREEYAPRSPAEEWSELFTEALREITLVEYLMDTMLTGTLEEKIDIMNGYREKVKRFERIVTEYSGREAGSIGGNDGGVRAGIAA